jgi:peptidoglycan/LPS O-acetylase OafA/YrhL
MLVLSVMVAVQIFTVPLVFRYQLAFLPPMAALIWVFAHGRGVLSRLLRHPTLQRLGEASFALYLIHRPMVSFMERWAGVSVMRDVALALAMMALALFASVLIFALIDRPLQQWLRRRERRAMTAEPLAIRP